MNSYNMLLGFITFLAIILTASSQAVTAIGPGCHEVRFANKFTSGALKVVCRTYDKKQDLGTRTLAINQEFVFQVCIDIGAGCCVEGGPGRNLFLPLFTNAVVPKAGDPCTGQVCYVAVKDDGIYYSGQFPPPSSALKKMYIWFKELDKCSFT